MPEAHYPKHIELLCSTYDRLLNSYGYDSVVIHSGSIEHYYLDDNYLPFLASPHFRHWLPLIDRPDCFVVYTPGSKVQLLYNQPIDFINGVPEDPHGFWTNEFDIHCMAKLEQSLEKMKSSKRTLFLGQSTKIGEKFDVINDSDFLHELYLARTIKNRYEQECIRGANRLGAEAHKVAEKLFREGQSEYDINNAYLQSLRVGANGLPYPNIVGINTHGSILHYQVQDTKAPATSHSMLIDGGAVFNAYVSDITRTYAMDQTSEFAAMIKAMDTKQQGLCDMMKVGVDYLDIHMAGHRLTAELLTEFGFTSLGIDELVEKQLTAKFFPHGIGHFLGIQVHDAAGRLSNRIGETLPAPAGQPMLRCTRTVEAGNVHTIEPGFYFIDCLLKELADLPEASSFNWEKIESFKKFGGIRIEDNVLTLDDGVTNFTREFIN